MNKDISPSGKMGIPSDIIFHILLFIDDILFLHKLKSINKQFKNIITNEYFKKIWNTHNKINHLEILLKLNPNKPWDWDELSLNPNITWEIIQQNKDKPWNWYWLSQNPNIT